MKEEKNRITNGITRKGNRVLMKEQNYNVYYLMLNNGAVTNIDLRAYHVEDGRLRRIISYSFNNTSFARGVSQ